MGLMMSCNEDALHLGPRSSLVDRCVEDVPGHLATARVIVRRSNAGGAEHLIAWATALLNARSTGSEARHVGVCTDGLQATRVKLQNQQMLPLSRLSFVPFGPSIRCLMTWSCMSASKAEPRASLQSAHPACDGSSGHQSQGHEAVDRHCGTLRGRRPDARRDVHQRLLALHAKPPAPAGQPYTTLADTPHGRTMSTLYT